MVISAGADLGEKVGAIVSRKFQESRPARLEGYVRCGLRCGLRCSREMEARFLTKYLFLSARLFDFVGHRVRTQEPPTPPPPSSLFSRTNSSRTPHCHGDNNDARNSLLILVLPAYLPASLPDCLPACLPAWRQTGQNPPPRAKKKNNIMLMPTLDSIKMMFAGDPLDSFHTWWPY